ncbi:hypothetical protein ADN00_09870 [Ornatilinea apprima]|uniref:Uncharacterized protein n=1 Tax=Ornatilinea apprima TaxID=1134406 RepID=A0A0P6XL26_9CHLR|nr:hypothetical protein [Ornatilinea apprima]KPL76897.1 hypothetical protein ADN00_09870 [Ornatilinea apprima]
MRWKKPTFPIFANRVGLRLLFSRLAQSFLAFALLPVLLLEPVNPADQGDEGRLLEREVSVMGSHWQLLLWSDGSTVCDLYLKHDQWPSQGDVQYSCGNEILEQWLLTPACSAASGSACRGLLLRFVGKTPLTYTEEIALPPMQLRLEPLNCTPGEWCPTRPLVRLSAAEPLDGYQIKSVHARVEGVEKAFYDSSGQFNLPLTGEQGSWLEVWAESSYGDRSEIARLRYRNVASPDGGQFHLDLLSEPWRDQTASGSLLWNLFAPVDGSLPRVLQQPQSAQELATDQEYLYLAGYLIQSGKADASACPDGGLYLGGSASPCGVEAAAGQTRAWQNQYDAQIYQAALKYNVPARALKGMIAQESQFWSAASGPYERGLGHVTSDGVDMLLIWNVDYYLQVCQTMYQEQACAGGYASLPEENQRMLRKAVLDKLGGPEELDVLAAMLLASASQTGQMVANLSRQEPMYTTTYTDMWKLSIANYHAGAGCTAEAITRAIENKQPITWDAAAAQLSPQCQQAQMYIEKVFDAAP